MNLSRRLSLSLRLLFVLVATGLVQPSIATTVQTQAESSISDEIASLREQLQAANELDANAKKQIQDLLISAQESQKKRVDLESKLKEILAQPDAEKKAADLSEQLQKLKQEPTVESQLANVRPLDLEENITTTKDAAKKLKDSVTAIDAEINRRAGRRGSIRTRTAELDEQIAQTKSQMESLSETDISLRARSASAALKERLASLILEAELFQAETSRFELEEKNGLLQIQKELLDAQLKQSQELLAGLEKIRAERMKQSANNTAIEAKQQQLDIREQFPALVPSYEINTRFAERNQAVAKRLAEINSQKNSIAKKTDELQREFHDTKFMIDRIGLSGPTGALLRKGKSELPNSQASLLAADRANAEADEVQFEIFEIDRQLASLSSESVMQEIIDGGTSQIPPQLKVLEEPIETLIKTRWELLTGTRTNLNTLFKSLVDIEFADRTLALVSTEFRSYINERILWIRSNKLLFSQLQIDDSDLKVVSPAAWQIVAQRFQDMVRGRPLWFGLIGFAIATLFVLKRRLRNRVVQLGQVASRGSCDTFWPTAKTLFATFLIAMTGPAIFLSIGLFIQHSEFNDGTSLFSALGFAFLTVAWFAIPIEFLRRMCREDGLAQKHFAWPDDAVRILKRNLDWLSPVGGLIVFGITLLLRLDLTHQIDLSERLMFVAGMICLTIFLYRCLHPKTGIFHEYLKAHERSWVTQTATAWFSGILWFPITFGVLAIVGYYYTALNLLGCVFLTFVVAAVGETLRALLLRFILVQRRHIHIEASKRKRQLDRDLREKEHATNNEATEALHAAEAAHRLEAAGVTEALMDVDVDVNAGEANRLVSLGMWLVWGFALLSIWSDVLPALQALERPIVPGTQVSTEQVVADSESAPPEMTGERSGNSDGEKVSEMMPGVSSVSSNTTAAPESELSRVTYRDLLIFLVIGAITITVARSLPSTLEIFFLNQLPMDRSVRYAIKSLVSYGIVLIGMMFAFRALQIGWSNVQWLATALTFGLAFGLQEIFANFVAGIILMFERPMRLGDWITIGDYSGTVSRIRTRATTLVSLDRKEYVVPNKDFITGRLVNWTLSDAINRVDITVGVAYGSNVKKAKEILLAICSGHPKVVRDPATTVIFQEFGESSLNLVARAFVSDIDCRMPVIDELHTSINDAFIDAGIEISFPQRDLHIRSASSELGEALRGSTPNPITQNVESAAQLSSGELNQAG